MEETRPLLGTDNQAAPASASAVLASLEGEILPEGSTQPAPGWVAPVFIALATILVGYVVVLGLTLPVSATARHWDVAWEGFDLGLIAMLALSAYFAWRRNPYVTHTTSAAATFLVIDAWFDTVTSRAGSDRLLAIGLAVLVEIPLAGLCLYLARYGARVTAKAITRLADATGIAGEDEDEPSMMPLAAGT